MHNTQQLVINWHLTEACNYHCQYCYAAWNKDTSSRELIYDREHTIDMLKEVYNFFKPNNLNNPLTHHFNWNSVRLNLAGGEPLLHANKLPFVVAQARKIGFEVSMISNGSYLDKDLLNKLSADLTWLGLSVDTNNASTNKTIGRTDRHGRQLDLEALFHNLRVARQNTPNLRLKLNTVINQANYNENLSTLINLASPEKWKVLRMLPVVNDDLSVTSEQFAQFVARHKSFNEIMCIEDNQDMRDSYLMIDPHGRFFQNSHLIVGSGYLYSRPILAAGAKHAFSEIPFNHQLFNARYVPAREKVLPA